MDLLRKLGVFGPQSENALTKATNRLSREVGGVDFRIRPGDYFFDKFSEAKTLGEAFRLQEGFAEELIPQIKDQVGKYRHTTGDVFEKTWELWHCGEILRLAIESEKGIQKALKEEVLRKTKEASDAFKEFNKKIKFDSVNDGKAKKIRQDLADRFIVALTALKIVNTQPLDNFPVNIKDHITGDQLAYVVRGPRAQ